jgi:hypothetical protein
MSQIDIERVGQEFFSALVFGTGGKVKATDLSGYKETQDEYNESALDQIVGAREITFVDQYCDDRYNCSADEKPVSSRVSPLKRLKVFSPNRVVALRLDSHKSPVYLQKSYDTYMSID